MAKVEAGTTPGAMSSQEMSRGRELVAQACRILAMEGVVDGVLGHVSLRVDSSRMLVRCRGTEEHGLLFSAAEDVKLVDFDGRGEETGTGYSVPNELPIHGEILRSRPDANAVVHAHPPDVLVCGIADLELRPVFGSFNIPAMRLALAGIPIYPRSVLIRRAELAREMIAAMRGSSVCVLRGHGITVCGESVEQAVVTALNLNALAGVTVALARVGARPENVTPEDLDDLPDLGNSFNDQAAWRFLVAKARRLGL